MSDQVTASLKGALLLVLAGLLLPAVPAYCQDFVWSQRMGGTGDDEGNGVAVDGSGNVYTVGEFELTVDFDPGPGTFNLTSAGDKDIFVSKLDSAGNFVWARQMGGMGQDEGNGVAVDAGGNVYTTGEFSLTADFDPGPGVFSLTPAGQPQVGDAGAGDEIFVSKLDSAGNFVWARQMGGMRSDTGYGVAVDGTGNVYATGYFTGTADFDPGPGVFNLTSNGIFLSNDMFVSKLDSAGSLVWAKQLGGVERDWGYSVAVDGAGNIYAAGRFDGTVDFDAGLEVFTLTSAGSGDVLVSKLDSEGNFVWARQMGGPGYDEGYGVAVDGGGNVYTTGSFDLTADFDPAASVFNLTSVGIHDPFARDIFVSKLDSAGRFVWAKQMGGPGYDEGYGVAVDGDGNVYTTGSFSEVADLDPGAGVFNLTPAGSSDVIVSKLDGDGNFVWARQMGGMGAGTGNGVAVDSSGNVYTAGEFTGTADFDPGPGVFNLTSVGDDDIFVSKLAGPLLPPEAVTGVLDAASFKALISPGSIVSVFGNFVETTATASSIPLGENLAGVSVTFNDIPGALFGVFDGDFDQSNVQVPWNVDVSSGKVEVKVHWKDETNEVWSDPFEVDAASASPGIYVFPPSTTRAIVTNFKQEGDDVIAGSWAQAPGSIDPITGQPAAIGGVVTIWGNGLGPVSPEPPTGDIPPAGTVPVTDKTVRVFVGLVEAQVLGSVLQPTSVGLNQINIIIPDGAMPGDAVPIVIEVECPDGTKIRSRNDVTISVRAAP